MSRIVPHGDMTADEIIQCSYDPMAIVALCENVTWNLGESGPESHLPANISTALKLAHTLMGPVHDALESHEGLKESHVRSDAAPVPA